MLPSKNSTLPVGVPPSAGFTVASRLTDWPKVEGFGEAVSVVVGGYLVTTWVRAVDVEAA